ncbi:helix-turn-helix transcriptional regulator [uncultured Anaerococcus sp.]|uniref:helix-turn-helix transcriptional regulator n=1 Tax=uncultured Anaerococcus sp. TaxID=293428 RepID=UPI002803CDB0|nr:helix-turn-helix transcriptional regulator [uncultured Anaerococcus sp.]
MSSNFSKRLKQLREANKMTQGQLGDKINTTRQSISNYEMGKREPDYETLEALADTFNVDINYLLGKTNKTTFLPSSNHVQITYEEQRILDPFNKLDKQGQEKAISYTQDLVDSGKYKKTIKEDTSDYITTIDDMRSYLMTIPMAAFDGKLNPAQMDDEEIISLYKLLKDNE